MQKLKVGVFQSMGYKGQALQSLLMFLFFVQYYHILVTSALQPSNRAIGMQQLLKV